MLGPVFDNDFGVMYSFKILGGLELEYDPEKWDNASINPVTSNGKGI